MKKVSLRGAGGLLATLDHFLGIHLAPWTLDGYRNISFFFFFFLHLKADARKTCLIFFRDCVYIEPASGIRGRPSRLQAYFMGKQTSPRRAINARPEGLKNTKMFKCSKRVIILLLFFFILFFERQTKHSLREKRYSGKYIKKVDQ